MESPCMESQRVDIDMLETQPMQTQPLMSGCGNNNDVTSLFHDDVWNHELMRGHGGALQRYLERRHTWLHTSSWTDPSTRAIALYRPCSDVLQGMLALYLVVQAWGALEFAESPPVSPPKPPTAGVRMFRSFRTAVISAVTEGWLAIFDAYLPVRTEAMDMSASGVSMAGIQLEWGLVKFLLELPGRAEQARKARQTHPPVDWKQQIQPVRTSPLEAPSTMDMDMDIDGDATKAPSGSVSAPLPTLYVDASDETTRSTYLDNEAINTTHWLTWLHSDSPVNELDEECRLWAYSGSPTEDALSIGTEQCLVQHRKGMAVLRDHVTQMNRPGRPVLSTSLDAWMSGYIQAIGPYVSEMLPRVQLPVYSVAPLSSTASQRPLLESQDESRGPSHHVGREWSEMPEWAVDPATMAIVQTVARTLVHKPHLVASVAPAATVTSTTTADSSMYLARAVSVGWYISVGEMAHWDTWYTADLQLLEPLTKKVVQLLSSFDITPKGVFSDRVNSASIQKTMQQWKSTVNRVLPTAYISLKNVKKTAASQNGSSENPDTWSFILHTLTKYLGDEQSYARDKDKVDSLFWDLVDLVLYQRLRSVPLVQRTNGKLPDTSTWADVEACYIGAYPSDTDLTLFERVVKWSHPDRHSEASLPNGHALVWFPSLVLSCVGTAIQYMAVWCVVDTIDGTLSSLIEGLKSCVPADASDPDVLFVEDDEQRKKLRTTVAHLSILVDDFTSFMTNIQYSTENWLSGQSVATTLSNSRSAITPSDDNVVAMLSAVFSKRKRRDVVNSYWSMPETTSWSKKEQRELALQFEIADHVAWLVDKACSASPASVLPSSTHLMPCLWTLCGLVPDTTKLPGTAGGACIASAYRWLLKRSLNSPTLERFPGRLVPRYPVNVPHIRPVSQACDDRDGRMRRMQRVEGVWQRWEARMNDLSGTLSIRNVVSSVLCLSRWTLETTPYFPGDLVHQSLAYHTACTATMTTVSSRQPTAVVFTRATPINVSSASSKTKTKSTDLHLSPILTSSASVLDWELCTRLKDVNISWHSASVVEVVPRIYLLIDAATMTMWHQTPQASQVGVMQRLVKVLDTWLQTVAEDVRAAHVRKTPYLLSSAVVWLLQFTEPRDDDDDDNNGRGSNWIRPLQAQPLCDALLQGHRPVSDTGAIHGTVASLLSPSSLEDGRVCHAAPDLVRLTTPRGAYLEKVAFDDLVELATATATWTSSAFPFLPVYPTGTYLYSVATRDTWSDHTPAVIKLVGDATVWLGSRPATAAGVNTPQLPEIRPLVTSDLANYVDDAIKKLQTLPASRQHLALLSLAWCEVTEHVDPFKCFTKQAERLARIAQFRSSEADTPSVPEPPRDEGVVNGWKVFWPSTHQHAVTFAEWKTVVASTSVTAARAGLHSSADLPNARLRAHTHLLGLFTDLPLTLARLCAMYGETRHQALLESRIRKPRGRTHPGRFFVPHWMEEADIATVSKEQRASVAAAIFKLMSEVERKEAKGKPKKGDTPDEAVSIQARASVRPKSVRAAESKQYTCTLSATEEYWRSLFGRLSVDVFVRGANSLLHLLIELERVCLDVTRSLKGEERELCDELASVARTVGRAVTASLLLLGLGCPTAEEATVYVRPDGSVQDWISISMGLQHSVEQHRLFSCPVEGYIHYGIASPSTSSLGELCRPTPYHFTRYWFSLLRDSLVQKDGLQTGTPADRSNWAKWCDQEVRWRGLERWFVMCQILHDFVKSRVRMVQQMRGGYSDSGQQLYAQLTSKLTVVARQLKGEGYAALQDYIVYIDRLTTVVDTLVGTLNTTGVTSSSPNPNANDRPSATPETLMLLVSRCTAARLRLDKVLSGVRVPFLEALSLLPRSCCLPKYLSHYTAKQCTKHPEDLEETVLAQHVLNMRTEWVPSFSRTGRLASLQPFSYMDVCLSAAVGISPALANGIQYGLANVLPEPVTRFHAAIEVWTAQGCPNDPVPSLWSLKTTSPRGSNYACLQSLMAMMANWRGSHCQWLELSVPLVGSATATKELEALEETFEKGVELATHPKTQWMSSGFWLDTYSPMAATVPERTSLKLLFGHPALYALPSLAQMDSKALGITTDVVLPDHVLDAGATPLPLCSTPDQLGGVLAKLAEKQKTPRPVTCPLQTAWSQADQDAYRHVVLRDLKVVTRPKSHAPAPTTAAPTGKRRKRAPLAPVDTEADVEHARNVGRVVESIHWPTLRAVYSVWTHLPPSPLVVADQLTTYLGATDVRIVLPILKTSVSSLPAVLAKRFLQYGYSASSSVPASLVLGIVPLSSGTLRADVSLLIEFCETWLSRLLKWNGTLQIAGNQLEYGIGCGTTLSQSPAQWGAALWPTIPQSNASGGMGACGIVEMPPSLDNAVPFSVFRQAAHLLASDTNRGQRKVRWLQWLCDSAVSRCSQPSTVDSQSLVEYVRELHVSIDAIDQRVLTLLDSSSLPLTAGAPIMLRSSSVIDISPQLLVAAKMKRKRADEPDVQPEADPEADPEAEVEPEAGPEADVEPEVGPEVGPEAGPEAEPEAEPEEEEIVVDVPTNLFDTTSDEEEEEKEECDGRHPPSGTRNVVIDGRRSDAVRMIGNTII